MRHEKFCLRSSSRCPHCHLNIARQQDARSHEEQCTARPGPSKKKRKPAKAADVSSGCPAVDKRRKKNGEDRDRADDVSSGGPSVDKRRKKNGEDRGRRFACAGCAAEFDTLGGLLVHRRRHYAESSTKRFVCPLCRHAFVNRRQLASHTDSHHGDPSGGSTEDACPPDDRSSTTGRGEPAAASKTRTGGLPASHRCGDCEASFPRWHQLQRHRLVFHAETSDRDLRRRGLPWQTDESVAPPWESRTTDEDGTTRTVVDRRLRDVYAENMALINSGHDRGRLRGVYNYPLNDFTGDLQDVRLHMESVYRREQFSFRVNLSMGLILRHVETDELRYFTAYYNAVLLRSPFRINADPDVERFIKTLEDMDIAELLMRNADSTKWKKVLVTNVNYYVYRTNYPIGGAVDLPGYIADRNMIVSFVRDSNNRLYRDNLCAFRCLAFARTGRRRGLERDVTEDYMQWREYCLRRDEDSEVRTPEDGRRYAGVRMSDLPAFEECFRARVDAFSLRPDLTCTRVYRSSLPTDVEADVTMTVNLHGGHFSAISSLERYAKKYCCRSCSRLFRMIHQLKRHEGLCNNRVSYAYPGGLYKPGRSVFDQLEEDVGVVTPAALRHFPYFAVYDFESVLEPTAQPDPAVDVGEAPPKSSYVTRHKAVCVSICSNVPGFTEPHCIVDPDTDSLVASMVVYLERVQAESSRLARVRWRRTIARLTELSGAFPLPPPEDERETEEGVHAAGTDGDFVVDAEEEGESDARRPDCLPDVIDEPEEDVLGAMRDHEFTSLLFARRVDRLKEDFDAYLEALPVLGFNSSNYDLNLIKESFPKHLKLETEQKFVVKKNNQYSAVVTKKFRFLDIANFLAAGSSYVKFLAAYGCEQRKGHLCYEWFDRVEKLDHPRLPDYDAFHSKLRGENVLETEHRDWEKQGGTGPEPETGPEVYDGLLELWRDRGMRTFADYLRYYADLDTGPFVEGVEKMSRYYFDKGVDLLKDAISAPGVARKLLFEAAKKEGAYFSLFSEAEADLYQKLKRCAVGGPSVIFTRYVKAGETLIRGGETSSTVLGFDCNAMYVKCMEDRLPVMFPVRRRAETGFRPEVSWGHMEMFQWMEWLSTTGHGGKINHKLNSSREFRIGPYLLDGWQTRDEAEVDDDDADGGGRRKSHPVLKKAFEFHGCWTHGHDPEACLFRTAGLRETSDETAAVLRKRAERTRDKEQFILSQGVELEVIYECQFAEVKRHEAGMTEHLRDMLPPFYLDRPTTVSERQVLDAVEDGVLTGLVEVDIRVPDEWPEGKRRSDAMSPPEFFAEMSPVFCNASVHFNEWGETMQRYTHDVGMNTGERRLLVGGMAAERLFVASNLLQWYLEMGLEVTRVHQVVEYKFSAAFGGFCRDISDARRKGDSDASNQVLAETCKVIGNASYGSLLMDKTKHLNVKYTTDQHDVHLAVNDVRFRTMTELPDSMYELEMLKRRTRLDVPIQLAFCILQTAKLILLRFYYQCLDYYVDRSKFQLVLCDTDSMYFALSEPTFREAVRPELLPEYDEKILGRCYDLYQRDSASPVERLDPETHVGEVSSVCLRSPAEWFPRECCEVHRAFDRREPGLFKKEASGHEIIALASKTYHLERGDDLAPSVKAKGINRRSLAAGSAHLYREALFERRSGSATNRGFRAHQNTVQTYTQSRVGFTFFYVKRKVHENGIDTSPLDLVLCPYDDHNVTVLTAEDNVLSNDYALPMEDADGLSFLNATHMYLHRKAVFNDCPEIAARLLVCRKPSAMRRTASFIPCKDAWFAERERTMLDVLRVKRGTDDAANAITEALERCMGKDMVHPGDRHDLYWTSGLDAALSDITAPSDYRGANSMGLLWTKIRDDPQRFLGE